MRSSLYSDIYPFECVKIPYDDIFVNLAICMLHSINLIYLKAVFYTNTGGEVLQQIL